MKTKKPIINTLKDLNELRSDIKLGRAAPSSKDGELPYLRYDVKAKSISCVIQYYKGNRRSSYTIAKLSFDELFKRADLIALRKLARKTKEDLEERFNSDNGLPSLTIPQLFEQYSDDFLVHCSKGNNVLDKFPSNYQNFLSALSASSLLDDLPLSSFDDETEYHLMNDFTGRRGKVLSFSTKRRYINSLRTFISYLIEKRVISSSPFGTYKHKRDNESRNNAINPNDYIKVLKYLFDQNTQEHDFMFLLFMTGARRNELLTLQKRNIDLRSCTIKIHKTKEGKSKLLRFIKGNGEFEAILSRNNLNHSEFLFYNNKSKTGRLYLSKVVNEIKDLLNLDNFTTHGARHSFAVFQYAKNNMKPYTLKGVLGHSNVAQTVHYLNSIGAFMCDLGRQEFDNFDKLYLA